VEIELNQTEKRKKDLYRPKPNPTLRFWSALQLSINVNTLQSAKQKENPKKQKGMMAGWWSQLLYKCSFFFLFFFFNFPSACFINKNSSFVNFLASTEKMVWLVRLIRPSYWFCTQLNTQKDQIFVMIITCKSRQYCSYKLVNIFLLAFSNVRSDRPPWEKRICIIISKRRVNLELF